jgi:hypothetical protein
VPGRVTCKVLATIAGIGEDGAGGGGWERRSIGPGAHGMRDYDWTAVALDSHADTSGLPDGWGHWLLVRRQVQPAEGKTMRELAFYRCAGPTTNPLRELIRMAGARWAIEECFQTAKNEAGLDHYQVRIWRAWYAHITLAMLALAYLAATRAREHRNDHESAVGRSAEQLIPFRQRDPSTTRHARPRPAHLCRSGPSLVTLTSTTAIPRPAPAITAAAVNAGRHEPSAVAVSTQP